MLAIVLNHYSLHGVTIGTPGGSWQQALNAINASYGKWGVDIFVLITGYFARGTRSYIRHMSRLWAQLFTTGAILFLAFLAFNHEAATQREFVRAILPITSSTWWFATAFFALITISPALTFFSRAATERLQLCTILVMLVVWGVAQYLPGNRFYFSEVLLFAELYLIAAYVRQFVPVGNPRRWAWAATTLISLLGISAAAMQLATLRWPTLAPHVLTFTADSSPLTILAAVAALCVARAIPPRRSPVVNWVGSMTFGVYLLHDYPLMRAWLWPIIPGINHALAAPWFPLHAAATVIGVYIAATIAEAIREYFIQKPVMRLIQPVARRIDVALPRIGDGIVHIVRQSFIAIGEAEGAVDHKDPTGLNPSNSREG